MCVSYVSVWVGSTCLGGCEDACRVGVGEVFWGRMSRMYGEESRARLLGPPLQPVGWFTLIWNIPWPIKINSIINPPETCMILQEFPENWRNPAGFLCRSVRAGSCSSCSHNKRSVRASRPEWTPTLLSTVGSHTVAAVKVEQAELEWEELAINLKF